MSGCWLWTGHVDKNGYGSIKVKGKTCRVHRVSYETHMGPIPEGLVIDHLCRVTCCANPNHLEPVTNRENIRRGVSGDKGKHHREKKLAQTHCPHGHAYSGKNLRYAPSGQRVCRTCSKLNMRRYRAPDLEKRTAAKSGAREEKIAQARKLILDGYMVDDICKKVGRSEVWLSRNFRIREMRSRVNRAGAPQDT